MRSTATTYQHIADILSFETSDLKLKQTLNQPSFDWDPIVVEGSKHLMLPALYSRLESKQILEVLPKDLKHYLYEITSLNRDRNHAILDQVKAIAKLFNDNDINHAFLKGSALLVLGCFNDNAERMIGDIDILVELKQLDMAFQLLQNEGYQTTEQTLGNHFFEHKHLPRLTVSHGIGAIELHRKLFTSYVQPELENPKLLENKIKIDDIYIPLKEHLLMHNILNSQINDHGRLYNSLSFRSAYDTISLLRNYHQNIPWNNAPYVQQYFNITGLFFKDISLKFKTQSNRATVFYSFKLRHPSFHKLWNKLLKSSYLGTLLLKRLSFFVSNKTYRQSIIQERERIFSHLKSIIRKI